jgi:aerobic-type carbon monoxide dehydrogenase small subunit (CoxS/CutS family)
MSIQFEVNGKKHQVADNRAPEKLLDFLHEELNLTGTKLCCGIGICRACTVSVAKGKSPEEEPVLACSTALSTLDGARITTVEGVSNGRNLLPIQEAFLDHFSFQCGYCTPGFVMASKIFLDWLKTAPIMTDAQLDTAIDDAIGEHICRCTGYVRYYQALKEQALVVLEAEQ